MTWMTVRRLTAALVAIAAGAGLSVSAGPAQAAVTLPDPSRTAALHVHKLAAPDSLPTLPADGTAVDRAGLVGLPGVGFTLRPVTGIDLATRAGQIAAATLAQTLDPASNAAAEASVRSAGHALGNALTGVTDGSGDLSFPGLPLGLYLLTETAPPPGATAARPTMISLPLTDPAARGSWLYDVHVYPKNALTSITKTVEDADAAGPGDTVRWTITADIPNAVGPAAALDAYEIHDRLDDRLHVERVSVQLDDGSVIPDGSFEVVMPSVEPVLKVRFVRAGLVFLAEHAAARVVVSVESTVLAAGEIANTAVLFPNAASLLSPIGTPGGPVTSSAVTTKWGEVSIAKIDSSGARLAGAVFSLYRTESDARQRRNPMVLDGRTSLEVDASGRLTLAPVRYSDWADGAAVDPDHAGFHYVYLVEEVAPRGFVRLEDPIRLRVDASTSTAGVDVTVTNLRRDTPVCPAPDSGDSEARASSAQALDRVAAASATSRDCDEDAPTPSPNLPNTGGPAGWVLLVALVLIGVGALLVTRGRRAGMTGTPAGDPTRG